MRRAARRAPQRDSGGALRVGGGFSDPARASTVPSRSITQMRAVVRDRPSMICAISGDADGGSDGAGAARSSARSRANDAIGIGRRREQPRPVVQRGGHRLRGAGQRALLRVAQHALQLAHVLVAEPRQREEHGEDEQELRADRRARRGASPSTHSRQR